MDPEVCVGHGWAILQGGRKKKREITQDGKEQRGGGEIEVV